MPVVEQRDPQSGSFEEIEPDSADEDFDHEYEEMCAINGYNNKSQSDLFAHLDDKVEKDKTNKTHQVTSGKNKDNFAA